MVSGEKYVDGLTNLEAFNGIKIGEIPGNVGGPGPFIAVLFWGADGLPPNNPSIGILGFPGNGGASGTDSNGSISCTRTFTNSGDDKEFFLSGGGSAILPNGMLDAEMRMEVNSVDGTRWMYIQFSALDIDSGVDFPGVPPPPSIPDQPVNTIPPDPEDETGQLTISWESNSSLSTDEDGFVIERQKGAEAYEVVGSIPSSAITFPNYSFVDYLGLNGLDVGTGIYRYRIRAYFYSPNTISGPSPISLDIDWDDPSPPPDIEVPGLGGTGTGGIDLGGFATIILIADPSGIYTLVPDKTHDTLYERSGAVTTIEAKIPDPYIRTGFIE